MTQEQSVETKVLCPGRAGAQHAATWAVAVMHLRVDSPRVHVNADCPPSGLDRRSKIDPLDLSVIRLPPPVSGWRPPNNQRRPRGSILLRRFSSSGGPFSVGVDMYGAKLPAQPLPRSNASPALLAYIATVKYQDGLPLYRQERAFPGLDIELPRSTLARWMLGLGELITPLTDQLREHLKRSPAIHMDETTVQVNTEPGRSASSPSYMWVQRGGPPAQQVVLFDYDPSRAGFVPKRLLEGFGGTLLADSCDGYAQAVREHTWCTPAAGRMLDASSSRPRSSSPRARPGAPTRRSA